MLSGGTLQDQMLKTYIDKIFDKYDTDSSGTLDEDEMTFFFNDLFKSLNMNIVVNRQQALQAIKSIDQNFDGAIDKKQLFDAFKVMMNKPSPQQAPPQYGQPYGQPYGAPYGQYPNPYQQPYQPYQQPYQYSQQYPNNPYQSQSQQPYMANQYNPYVQRPPVQYPYGNTGNIMSQSQGNPYGNNNPYGNSNPYGNNNPYGPGDIYKRTR